MPNESPRLVIEGLTRDGKIFRPGDWAERLIETASTYGADRRAQRSNHTAPERRQRQIAFLQTQMIDGRKSLLIDLRLREANPAAYAFLMEFVENNQLRWREESAAPDDRRKENS